MPYILHDQRRPDFYLKKSTEFVLSWSLLDYPRPCHSAQAGKRHRYAISFCNILPRCEKKSFGRKIQRAAECFRSIQWSCCNGQWTSYWILSGRRLSSELFQKTLSVAGLPFSYQAEAGRISLLLISLHYIMQGFQIWLPVRKRNYW